jgi:ABC-type multidrug transport system ATPase subunit
LKPILEVNELTKSFKTFKAVDNLSFTIQHGEVYGFLGQNGAGKSTTMRMLLGLIFPDSGTISINGYEFNNSRRHLLKSIGAIIERPDMYGYLSGWDNLKIFATLSDSKITKDRLYEVLEIVGLKGREKDKFKAYSQGMKQRLGIAIAMAHNPDLLILDEPTNGLDPQGIAEIRALIVSLSRDHGKTILVSSHLLHEVEQMATSMLIIHRGKKVSDGKLSDLMNPDETLIEVNVKPNNNLVNMLSGSVWGQLTVSQTEEQIVLKMNPKIVPELNRWLVDNRIDVLSISSRHSFEAYFLNITNDTTTANRAI